MGEVGHALLRRPAQCDMPRAPGQASACDTSTSEQGEEGSMLDLHALVGRAQTTTALRRESPGNRLHPWPVPSLRSVDCTLWAPEWTGDCGRKELSAPPSSAMRCEDALGKQASAASAGSLIGCFHPVGGGCVSPPPPREPRELHLSTKPGFEGPTAGICPPTTCRDKQVTRLPPALTASS